MNKPKIVPILLLTIILLVIFIRWKSKSSPLLFSFDFSTALSPTCLQSYNAHPVHKSRFDMSMVHLETPSFLNLWVKNKNGFEIGAPSHATWGNLGVYDAAATVDTTNFASTTLWESGLKDGAPFLWKNQPKGKQYVRDAVDLSGIPSEHYDFVCASHVLEHIANPFKALLEWLRIMRSGGLLMIILPYKNVTFDHKRDVVTIEHLINDYHNKTTEADLSHLNEILRLHDLPMDPPAGNIESFKARSLKNLENRGLHQHVYDEKLLYHIFVCLNLKVKAQFTWGNNNLIIGQKQ